MKTHLLISCFLSFFFGLDCMAQYGALDRETEKQEKLKCMKRFGMSGEVLDLEGRQFFSDLNREYVVSYFKNEADFSETHKDDTLYYSIGTHGCCLINGSEEEWKHREPAITPTDKNAWKKAFLSAFSEATRQRVLKAKMSDFYIWFMCDKNGAVSHVKFFTSAYLWNLVPHREWMRLNLKIRKYVSFKVE